jgi:hypothetical protein
VVGERPEDVQVREVGDLRCSLVEQQGRDSRRHGRHARARPFRRFGREWGRLRVVGRSLEILGGELASPSCGVTADDLVAQRICHACSSRRGPAASRIPSQQIRRQTSDDRISLTKPALWIG